MRKILLILVVCLCFCSCAEKGKMTKEQTVSSEVLQEQQAEVFESITKDFDGNGTEETFQLRREGKMLKLWFVEDGGEIPLVQEENFVEYGPAQQNLRVYKLSDRAFCVAGESDTAWSVVYTVCDGVPVEQEIGKVSDFSQQEDGSFIGMASDLDVGYSVAEQKTVWGGRTIKPYWFTGMERSLQNTVHRNWAGNSLPILTDCKNRWNRGWPNGISNNFHRDLFRLMEKRFRLTGRCVISG